MKIVLSRDGRLGTYRLLLVSSPTGSIERRRSKRKMENFLIDESHLKPYESVVEMKNCPNDTRAVAETVFSLGRYGQTETLTEVRRIRVL